MDRLSAALAGRYEIEREIGQGGMATVYLARDLRHQRKVALKVLRPELSAILGSERFLHEIRTTANLQHPHILPLYDSGEADGLVFYVMPFVSGESLRDRLARETQLPVDDAVCIAREVADALDYAHRHGVIHRDIKPENILLHDGRAQVADFGIALAVSSAGGGTRMTETGMSLGTPHYMSPEQAMGEREISAKSDIYALGCVLYEMLVGEPPFTGPSAQAIIARVVTEEPRSLVTQRRSVSPHLEGVVRRALEKLPADRFQTAAQFGAALATPELVPLSSRAAESGVARARSGPPMPAWISPTRAAAVLGVLLLISLAALSWMALRSDDPPPAPVARFSLAPPENGRFLDSPGAGIAMSPDGSRFVYVGVPPNGVRQLFMRTLSQLEPVPIPGTAGAGSPFFSPDGAWVGFLAYGRIQKVALSGGPPLTITAVDSGFFGATWGPGDIVVFGMDAGLRMVPAAGGRPEMLVPVDTADDVTSYRLPHFMPDGRAVVFQASKGIGSFSPAVVSLDDRRVKTFSQPGGHPRYVSTGHLVLANFDGTVTATPFSARALEFTGSAVPVAEGVLVGTGGAAELGVSADGALVYASGSASSRAVVEVDRSGRVRELTTEMRGYNAPRISPDGSRVAVEISDASGNSIWVFELAQKTLTKLSAPGSAGRPIWTPDGSRLAYTAEPSETPDIAWIRADGSALSEPLLTKRGRQLADEWTPDGRHLIYHENTAAVTRNDIMVLTMDSAKTTRPYLKTASDEFGPAVSPDGRWVAYVSDESGRTEVYVRSFPEPGGKVQVSLDGGIEPRWARNGKELFYRLGDRIISATVATSPAFTVRTREELFRGNFTSFPYHAQYDVTANGRFIMTRGPETSTDLIVVLNWFDQLIASKSSGRAAGQ